MRHFRCSTDLVRAIGWWLAYLRHRPPARHSGALTRRSFIAGTDASGADRWLAAVLLDAAGSCWYTRCQTPQWLWDQLLPRGDHQIGVKEAFAVLSLFASFRVTMADSAVTVDVDNSGVGPKHVNEGSKAPETNAMVALFGYKCLASGFCLLLLSRV